MFNTEYTQMSEKYILGILLAIVGGYLDAYTYISRGHVFSNAQTGNIVFLGLNLSEGNWKNALYYMVPILAFVLGVLISEAVKTKFKQNTSIHWRQIIIAFEALVLLAVAFIPRGSMDVAANTAISFVCSLQTQSFRKFKGNPITTTMCTGNLRIATEQLFQWKRAKNSDKLFKSLQYYGIILFFIGGVILGALLTKIFVEKAVLFNCILLLAVFAIMFIKQDEVE